MHDSRAHALYLEMHASSAAIALPFLILGLAIGLAVGLIVGLGAFVLLTGGEGWQLLTNTVKIKLNIPTRSARFMGHAPLR